VLDTETMAALVAGAQGGVVLVDDNQRFVYANPSACHLLGHTLDQLCDHGLLGRSRAGADAAALAGFIAEAGDSTTTFSGVLLGADGCEREVVCSTFAIEVDGRRVGGAVLWDFTAPRDAARTALSLGQAAAQLVGTGSTSEILTDIARHAVEGSGALSCGISVVAEDHTLASAGAYGPQGPSYGEANPAWQALAGTAVDAAIEAMTVGTIAFAAPPGKPAVVPHARASWQANPITRPFAVNLAGLDWDCGVYAPVSWENRVIGFLAIFLPAGRQGPSVADLSFYRALADQAAVVVMNGRFATQAATAAALLERGRLARELHDSVSQGLFSMTLHARAAQLSLAAEGFSADDPLARSVEQLAELTRGALAEMRALIFELRPGGLAAEGLVGALRRTGAALAAREQITITVDGPDASLRLPPDAEEQVYRIAVEAMNNVAKHAHATHAAVQVTVAGDLFTVIVTDDGAGFDATLSHPGHLGLVTMAQRAGSIDAELIVTSAVGSGTTVALTLPVDRHET
jgi:signal transduction histidine kinase